MAERRMFHTSVVESDAFLDLPISAQALYFHLGMYADDDGFVNGPKKIARAVGCAVGELELLIDKKFLLKFEDVVVISHWLIANSLKVDRLKPLQYPEVAEKLYVSENRIYSTASDQGNLSLSTIRRAAMEAMIKRKESKKKTLDSKNESLESKTKPLESKRNPKVREGKVSKGKVSEDKIIKDNIEEDNAAVAAFSAEPMDTAAAEKESDLKYMRGRLGKGVVLLSDEQIGDLLERIGLDSFDYYVDKLSEFILKKQAKVKNHYATILKWWDEDRGVTYENESFTAQPLSGVYEGL